MSLAWRAEDVEAPKRWQWRVIPTARPGHFVIRRVVVNFAKSIAKIEQAEARRKRGGA